MAIYKEQKKHEDKIVSIWKKKKITYSHLILVKLLAIGGL